MRPAPSHPGATAERARLSGNEIGATAPDQQPGCPPAMPCESARVTGQASSQAHYAPNSAALVQAGAAVSSAVRRFTAEEDDLIRRCHDGEFKVDRIIRKLRTSPASYYRRVRELGLHMRVKRACHAPDPLGDLPKPKEGWIPIAHSRDGRWREYEGAPVSLDVARAAVEAGRATTAQVRIDGGFDLLFRMCG